MLLPFEPSSAPRFDVAPFELEAIDFALDVLETRLGFFDQQIGAAVRIAHDAARLLLSASLDVVGELLSGQQRRLPSCLRAMSRES